MIAEILIAIVSFSAGYLLRAIQKRHIITPQERLEQLEQIGKAAYGRKA
jgi:hypothetical protein